MLQILLWVVVVVMILYSPVELTRIILLVKSGYTMVAPSYWLVEIIAIWIGYALALFIAYRITKGR